MPKVGRPLSTEQTRLLVTLIGALANRGDAVVLSSLIARLGISEDEARSIIDTLVNLGAISPSFSVAELEGTEGISIPKTMQSHGKSLRLTPGETIAVDSALRRLGMFEDDPLRASILGALASPSVTEQDFGRKARQLANSDVARRVMQCSQALYYGTGLQFSYQGSSDAAPRLRRVSPMALKEDEGVWYLEAADHETGKHRSFRLDRMDAVEEDLDIAPAAPIEEQDQMVELVFHDARMLELLEWPRLEVVASAEGQGTRARIPYYGGPWLVRRLAACGGTVEIADDDLREAVRAYAAEQLGIAR